MRPSWGNSPSRSASIGDVDCRLGAALLYIKADAGNVRERFEREAHLHMVIDELSL
jgi:hypothetical protein